MLEKIIALGNDIISKNYGNTALFILDGLGTDPKKEELILKKVWKKTSKKDKRKINYPNESC